MDAVDDDAEVLVDVSQVTESHLAIQKLECAHSLPMKTNRRGE